MSKIYMSYNISYKNQIKSLYYNKVFFLNGQFNNEVCNFDVRVCMRIPYPGINRSCPRKEPISHHV